MFQIQGSWTDVKAFMQERGARLQFFKQQSVYYLAVKDDFFTLTSKLKDPSSADYIEFESSYKDDANKLLDPRDSDSASIVRMKISPAGWSYLLHGVEFETSVLNSTIEKDINGNESGFASIKFYDAQGAELTTQQDIDSSAVKTVVDWMPTYDYEILGGGLRFDVSVLSDVHLGVIAVPDLPYSYGGSRVFLQGINLRHFSHEIGVNIDGRVPKLLTYNADLKTNKLRIIALHSAGYKLKCLMTFELFKQ